MARILSKNEVNEIKIIIAVFYNPNISLSLRMDRIWDLFDILKYQLPESEEDSNPENIEFFMEEVPTFVMEINDAVINRELSFVKRRILKRLIEIEAYLEIVELQLDKIKL